MNRINRHLELSHQAPVGNKMINKTKSSLSVRDNRTGKDYEFKVSDGVISAMDLKKIKTSKGDVGLRSYDPGFKNTSAATSRITYIDGMKGLLTYRGYPIEQLAKNAEFLEVAFLLIYGELPTKNQYATWKRKILKHTFVHNDLETLMQTFRYDAHPMGMLSTALAAMGTLHPEANPALAGQDIYQNKSMRNKQIHRIIGNIATVAGHAYRHRIGRKFVKPSHKSQSYAEHFLYMLDHLSNNDYRPHPGLVKALNILFILHADHELNCSTSAMRHLTSSGVDVYSSVSASIGALYGPKHGGANEAVLRMLESIGSKENIPSFVEKVKQKKVKLMGFGHRVYRNYDPRARVVREIAKDVFKILGKEPLIEIAVALEQVALSDEYFVKRKLYPNVDFYSGLIYKAMGFPTDFFPVLFAIPRTVGWLAHWNEFLDDPENKIVRPRQVYKGPTKRNWVPMGERYSKTDSNTKGYQTQESKRRNMSSTPP